jgi:hypothetical protein
MMYCTCKKKKEFQLTCFLSEQHMFGIFLLGFFAFPGTDTQVYMYKQFSFVLPIGSRGVAPRMK